MFYIGIDIAKHNHEVSIIDDNGKALGKSFSISNSQKGVDKFNTYLDSFNITSENCVIGMESTGHYWINLFSFLVNLKFNVFVINPIQSDAFRKMYIRKTKNDSKDSYIIAQIMRFGEYSSSNISDENIFALRQLSRYRTSLVDECSSWKRKIISILDQVFPEYSNLFSDTFGVTSKELLSKYPLPENMLELLKSEITTITGIGDVLGACILSEIGDISRFEKASQLVAFAGLDVAVKQSGEFTGTEMKITKRGSPYLRRAIWLAATVASFKAPALSIYYKSLIARGKKHLTAIGAVSRKMCNIIFSVLKNKKAYTPNI